MKPSPQVAVIVVSYNTRALLIDCLQSIFESTGSTPVEVVVVDNASSDGSTDAVHTFSQATLIKNEVNRGFGAACNQAIRATTAPRILLLNSDARLTRASLLALCNTLEGNQRCGAAGCRIVNAEGIETINTWNFLTSCNQAIELSGIAKWVKSKAWKRSYAPRRDQNQPDCQVDWIDGACLMLRRSALDEVGMFDEQFFMYSEDEDLCFRLKSKGWSICHAVSGSAFHHGAASTKKNETEMLRQFYYSQLLFLAKHRGKLAITLFVVSMKLVLLLKQPFHRSQSRVPAERGDPGQHRTALSQAWSSKSWLK